MLEDCFLDMQGSSTEPWIESALHLQGQSELACPSGERHTLHPDAALLMRVDQQGSQFQLHKGQLVRHVGASSTLSTLRPRFGGNLPATLKAFDVPYGDSCHIRTMTPSARLRQLGSGLFSHHANGACRDLKLEAIANLFLSELIEGFEEGSDADDTLPPWEEQAYQDLLDQISGALDSTLSIPALADRVGLTESRLDQLFKQKHDQTCAEFIRNERMKLALRLLEDGSHPVKVVADKVGYGYVSNFSRAYRARFGETPARTLRRGASE